MKENTKITSIANYAVKVEGERHTLLIKSARISDGGKYCVTAVNQMGSVSSSATLIVKAGTFDVGDIKKHIVLFLWWFTLSFDSSKLET